MLAFKRWLTPPVFEGDEGKTAMARHLHVMTWFSLVMLTAYAAALPLAAPQLAHRVVIVAPILVVQVAVLGWLRRGRVVLASLVSLSGFWVIMALSTFISGGVRSAPYAGNVLIVLTAAILLGRQAAFGFAAASVVEGVILVWLELASRVPPLSTTPVSALLLQTTYMVVGTASLQFATFSIQAALERARHELSERRRAEEKYRSIVENAVDGIFQSTPEGRFLSVNPAMARMYGYASPHEMVQSVTDIREQVYADPDQRARLVQRLETDGLVSGYEAQDRRQDGSVFWTSMNVRAVRDQHGQTLYYEGSVEDVTERKRAEEALRVSEDKFSKAFRVSPDIISISSLKDGRFMEINEGFENVLGFRRDEVIGHTALELKTWRRPEERRAALAALETRRQIRGQEVVYQAKDGRLVTCLLSAEIIDLNGEPHLLAVSRDITERKQTEDMLRRRADEMLLLYRMEISLAGGQDLGSTLHALQAEIIPLIQADSLFVAIYDQDTDMVSYPVFFDLGHPVIEPSRRLTEQPGLAGAVIFSGKTLYLPDIMTPQVQETYHPINDNTMLLHTFLGVPLVSNERIIGAVSVQSNRVDAYTPDQIQLVENIAVQAALAIDKARLLDQLQQELAERRRAEQSAQRRAEQLATMNEIGRAVSTLQNLDSVLEIIYRQVQRIASVDAFYICLYDPDHDQISFPLMYDLGVRYQEPTIPLRPDTSLAHVIRTGEPFMLHRSAEQLQTPQDRGLGNIERKSASILMVPLWLGERVFGVLSVQSYTMNAYSDETAEILTGVGLEAAIAIQNAQLYEQARQEIAERKRVQMEREQLIAELEAKNAELERFTYTVSHDLKSPLVTIRGFLGFVEKDALAGNVERLKADMARITNATDKMQRLLSELLELSRIGRMMNPPQPVPFETIVREALELAHGRIEARGAQVSIAPDLPAVYGDRARLVEVVQNLVDNGCKFMGDQPEPRIAIGIRGADADGKPILFVRDNGIGIEPKYHDRIFGLFDKLDAQTEGTGVGLALVKRIIEVHGGRIWVESEPGHGATFYFTLPHS